MEKPPKDVPASELFLKLSQAEPPSEVIDFPRRNAKGQPVGQIRIRVLSSAEHDRARLQAFDTLKERYSPDQLQSLGLREVMGDRVARHLLSMACQAVEPINENSEVPKYGQVFPLPEHLETLRAHEISVLFAAYLRVQDKFGPYERHVDTDAWVKRLTEGGSAFPLLRLDTPEHVLLTSSLASRISILLDTLESLWPELPDSCKSRFPRFVTDKFFASMPASDSTESLDESTESSLEQAEELALRLDAQDRLRDVLDDD